MLQVRKGNERGVADFGWLQSNHSFSFGHYYDPQHVGFGPLRVINEDRVEPAAGFDTHGHRNMEIISYVLSGALEHKDSMGNGSVLRYGDVQRMSAGTGVLHSEYNPSSSEGVHFLQIWIVPERRGLEPGYEQHRFAPEDLRDQWRLVASGTPRDGALKIHQDVDLYATRLGAGRELTYVPAEGRKLWLQVARGTVEADGETLRAGDAAAWTDAKALAVRAHEDAELLLFDMTP